MIFWTIYWVSVIIMLAGISGIVIHAAVTDSETVSSQLIIAALVPTLTPVVNTIVLATCVWYLVRFNLIKGR